MKSAIEWSQMAKASLISNCSRLNFQFRGSRCNWYLTGLSLFYSIEAEYDYKAVKVIA